jgi:hypothetical protein
MIISLTHDILLGYPGVNINDRSTTFVDRVTVDEIANPGADVRDPYGLPRIVEMQGQAGYVINFEGRISATASTQVRDIVHSIDRALNPENIWISTPPAADPFCPNGFDRLVFTESFSLETLALYFRPRELPSYVFSRFRQGTLSSKFSFSVITHRANAYLFNTSAFRVLSDGTTAALRGAMRIKQVTLTASVNNIIVPTYPGVSQVYLSTSGGTCTISVRNSPQSYWWGASPQFSLSIPAPGGIFDSLRGVIYRNTVDERTQTTVPLLLLVAPVSGSGYVPLVTSDVNPINLYVNSMSGTWVALVPEVFR